MLTVFPSGATGWYLKHACLSINPIGRKKHHNIRKVPLWTNDFEGHANEIRSPAPAHKSTFNRLSHKKSSPTFGGAAVSLD
jgi:hypothetical protein